MKESATQRSHQYAGTVFSHACGRRLLTGLLLLAALAGLAAPESITLNFRKVLGFPVKFISVNMNDPDVVVTTAVAQRFPTGLESWGSFLNRLHPDAAINGTYFCQRTYRPVGDVAVNDNLIYRGVVGTALCITGDNRVEMRPGPRQVKPDWTGFRSVLCAGPRLLTRGQVTVNARAEGFRDPRVLGSASRSAVALRPDGQLLLLTIQTNISLKNLAYVCLHLGATEAMTLDGGNSSGLYAEDRTVTRPGRGLSNVLVVYATRERYKLLADRLAPPELPVLASLLPGAPTALRTTMAGAPLLPQFPVQEAMSMAAPGQSAPPASPLRLRQPDSAAPLKGVVPITVDVTPGIGFCWTTLRINDKLRAMTNVTPLEYRWDSTKEPDGIHTVEVTAWTEDRQVLAREVRRFCVQNTLEMAGVNEMDRVNP